MTIAVTAPTGNVGSRVLQLLIQAGERPRALARDPSRLPLPVDHRQGDLMDAGFLADALTGADTLFWVTPEVFGADDPMADMERMGANAAAAVRAAGVSRVVQISSVGAERGSGAGLIDGLARNEQQLVETGADVCTLRCGYYFTNLLGSLGSLRAGTLHATMPADRPIAWVDPRDVGEIAAVRLLSGWSGRQIAGVHGPEDLSFAAVAERLGAVLGREIRVEVIPAGVLETSLRAEGLSEKAAAGVAGMAAAVGDGFRPEQVRDELTTTPTTVESWAYATLRPLLLGPTS
nr:NAD(P)H-binding protein [uncultured Actinoplanes sp.]